MYDFHLRKRELKKKCFKESFVEIFQKNLEDNENNLLFISRILRNIGEINFRLTQAKYGNLRYELKGRSFRECTIESLGGKRSVGGEVKADRE